MCGISAIYSYHSLAPLVDQVELRQVRDHMAARGPDGCGEWFSEDQKVGIGHRRLAIIDLSNNAAQPMQNNIGSVVISFNGEIYNYRELGNDATECLRFCRVRNFRGLFRSCRLFLYHLTARKVIDSEAVLLPALESSFGS